MHSTLAWSGHGGDGRSSTKAAAPTRVVSARGSTPGSAHSEHTRGAHKLGKQQAPGPAGAGKQDGAERRGFACGSPQFIPPPRPQPVFFPACAEESSVHARSSFQHSARCLHRWSSGQEWEALKGEETQTFGCALQTPLSSCPDQPERSEIFQIKIHQEQAFTACSVPEFLILFTLVLIPTQVGVTEVRGQTQTFCFELFNLPSFISRAKLLLKLHERIISAF